MIKPLIQVIAHYLKPTIDKQEMHSFQYIYRIKIIFYPLPAKVSFLNFHPREVVTRYRDTQLLVGENYSY